MMLNRDRCSLNRRPPNEQNPSEESIYRPRRVLCYSHAVRGFSEPAAYSTRISHGGSFGSGLFESVDTTLIGLPRIFPFRSHRPQRRRVSP